MNRTKVCRCLLLATALLAATAQPRADEGVSTFVDGISKLMEFFKKLDGAIDQQASVEARRSLARELLKVNDSLLSLESNKQLLNESIADPDLDYARVGVRVQAIEEEVRRLGVSISKIRQFALVDDPTFDSQLVQKQLNSGLDAKLGSLKEIERTVLRKAADSSAAVNRDALIKEGEDAVRQVGETRRVVGASIKKLKQ